MASKSPENPLQLSMAVIGGPWKTSILWALKDATLRFGELREQLPGITERALSMQLKSLQKNRLVARAAYGEVPPRVEYSLTDEGRELLPVLEVLELWGRYRVEKDQLL